MPTSPTVAELRSVCQPAAITGRTSAEHWAGRLWARRVSIHVTRQLVRTTVTANQVTMAMIAVGFGGAAALLLDDAVVGAALCALGIQLYLLLDCVDGEIARWRGTSSPRGAYLDRIGHYVVEAALFATFGYAVGGSWQSGWVSVGLATSVLALVAKAETDLAPARPTTTQAEYDALVTPRVAPIRAVRAVVHPLRIHRWTGAAEASLLILVASITERAGWDDARPTLAIVFVTIAALLALGHGVAIWTSGRFDADGAGPA